MTRPLRSTPITGASPLLRAGPPADTATVLNVSQWLLLDALPLATPVTGDDSIDVRLPTFRTEAADRAGAAFMPDATWPISGTPARLIPELLGCPGFDATSWSRHVISGSLTLAFPTPT